MLARVGSVALIGTEAFLVDVEVEVAGGGMPSFTVVGLPSKGVKESEQRIRSALEASGQSWPRRRVVANLAPGTLRKDGTHFDLPLALALVAAGRSLEEGMPVESLQGWVAIGELALDGSVRPVRGALAAAMAARQAGSRGVVCPAGNASEVALVEGIEVVAVGALGHAVRFFTGDWEPPAIAVADDEPPPLALDDMRDVRGHSSAKDALEVAAAGGHNVLMEGPPGSGKTMLARRFPGILPSMSIEESLTVTRIYSVAGLLGDGASLIKARPFRAPHHSITTAGLVGGGPGLARPGEASLAHHGALFLDELSLYRRDVLDCLREPLEGGKVRISRSGGTISFPCSFSLIAATNPCPCGHADDRRKECRCSSVAIARHRSRLSGPLLDRIDMYVAMTPLSRRELLSPPTGESSAVIRARVEAARAMQHQRYGAGITNASARSKQLEPFLGLSRTARSFLEDSIDRCALSGRGVDRILRIARTIADLRGLDEVDDECFGKALTMRRMDSGEARVA